MYPKDCLVLFDTSANRRINRYEDFWSDSFGLYDQVNKRARWMPWQSEAMKDVVTCEKVRGAGKRALIRTYPNGETHRLGGIFCLNT